MLAVPIPGFRTLTLDHLVLDYNGTLACDGALLVGVRACLKALAGELRIHVVTADTFGSARIELEGVPCDLLVLGPMQSGDAKRVYVEKLGREATACIGNGRNDREMMEAAALSIAVIGREGAASGALAAAQVVAPDIVSALDLLRHPRRLIATLRS